MVKDDMCEVHIVGGHHPDWPFDYYERIIAAIHDARPRCRSKRSPRPRSTTSGGAGKSSPGDPDPPQGGRPAVDAGRRRRDLLAAAGQPLNYTGKADPERWCEIHGIAHGSA